MLMLSASMLRICEFLRVESSAFVTAVQADHVLDPDAVDGHVRGVGEVEHLAGTVDPGLVVAEVPEAGER